MFEGDCFCVRTRLRKRTYGKMLLLMCTIVLVKVQLGLSFLQVDPVEFSPDLTDRIIFSCRPRGDSLVQSFSRVLAVQLGIEDPVDGHIRPLATLLHENDQDQRSHSTTSGSFPITIASQWDQRATVTGFLDNSGSDRSYLRAVLSTPVPSDEGVYLCLVTGLNQDGVVVEIQASSNVTLMDLKSEQAALKAALISVLQRVENLEKEKASTDNRLASLEASNTNLTSHLQDVQRENEQLKQIVSSFTFSSSTPGSGPHPMVPTPRADYTVAFSARQSHPVLDSGVPVLYDDVLLNLGHGYHNVTGQFVAPVSGVYMFMGTVLPASNSSTPPTLIILDGGGTEMVMVTSTSGSGQGFGAVLLELSQGDRVSTREDYEQDMSGRQESDGGLLAFSGFLVSMEV